ncbi:MAG: hypothetical protein GXP60_06005 [Epsilonproteobacteria bacterium]|nr:hypothetical protein [Campylobacterota bacterium]
MKESFSIVPKELLREYPPSKNGAFIPTFKIQLLKSGDIKQAAEDQLQLSELPEPIVLKDERSWVVVYTAYKRYEIFQVFDVLTDR